MRSIRRRASLCLYRRRFVGLVFSTIIAHVDVEIYEHGGWETTNNKTALGQVLPLPRPAISRYVWVRTSSPTSARHQLILTGKARTYFHRPHHDNDDDNVRRRFRFAKLPKNRVLDTFVHLLLTSVTPDLYRTTCTIFMKINKPTSNKFNNAINTNIFSILYDGVFCCIFVVFRTFVVE